VPLATVTPRLKKTRSFIRKNREKTHPKFRGTTKTPVVTLAR
jgi:hypothetical protein